MISFLKTKKQLPLEFFKQSSQYPPSENKSTTFDLSDFNYIKCYTKNDVSLWDLNIVKQKQPDPRRMPLLGKKYKKIQRKVSAKTRTSSLGHIRQESESEYSSDMSDFGEQVFEIGNLRKKIYPNKSPKFNKIKEKCIRKWRDKTNHNLTSKSFEANN